MTIHEKLIVAVANYKMPSAGAALIKKSPPLILAGITAAGKETIAKRIISGTKYQQITNHTTREPRQGEVDGRDYFFVTEEKMLQLVNTQSLFEAAKVHGETIYASSLKSYQSVLDSGAQPLFVLDVQGIDKFLAVSSKLKPYFLLPPDFDEWLRRLSTRPQMSEAERQRRFASAKLELSHVRDDSRYILLINDDKDKTAAKILNQEKIDQTQPRQVLSKLLADINKQ